MSVEEKLNIEVFKIVTRVIAESVHLEEIADQLTQLLVGALEIKGCAVFVLNPETEELEVLGSSGLSIHYLNKGPILISKSIDLELRESPLAIKDVAASDRLQYPKDAAAEGIKAMVSVPINVYGKLIGVLRLYHYAVWDVSDQDLDFLSLLAQIVGLAMINTRLMDTLGSVKGILQELDSRWLRQSTE